MTDTTIYIGSLAIHEPVTALTDLLITILGIIFYFKIPVTSGVVKNWRLFFLFLSLSTLAGACGHGFFAIHEGIEYKSVWLTMQVLNGIGLFFAQKATLISVLKNSKNYSAWKWSYLIQLVVYLIALFIVQKYLVTIIDNAVALIPIMILHFTATEKEEYQKYIGYGIMISFITAIVHGTKLSLHAYFNYNDIAHVFIIISFTVMFMGVKQKATS
jgi:hypothetical protein